ncbi:MAG TPA: FAD-binding oxidoreductase [Solirubrobacterales bacterium]|nr:FAD-binding oxidoreductase [Solirubrobacterales bacterium]
MNTLAPTSVIPGHRGDVVTPADPEYDTLRAVFNGSIDRRPAFIARAESAADVQAAIRFARESGMALTPRAGGHSLAGFSAIDDGLVIDLRRLKGIEMDVASRRVRAGAGLEWGELDAATQAHGLAVTGGRISDTGVAGLTLGSGSGWLERRHGLTTDSLVAATVVTADGAIVRASAREHPDLFWALHGGGGNFGVVTEFEFRLHEVGPVILGGMLLFPLGRAAETLGAYREIMESADDDLGGCAAVLIAPPAPFVPPDLVGTPVLSIVAAAFGSLDGAEELVAPLRKLGPVADLVEPMPYTALQRMLDEGSPGGMHGQFESSFMDTLPDAAIDAVVELGARIVSPLTHVLIQPLGGAYARVAEETTALAHRDARWMYHALSMWEDPSDTPVNQAWTRDLVDALAPFARRSTHPNHVSSDRQDRVRSFYGPAAYERLVAVKDRWDPENVFRHNQNIRPSRPA